MKGRKAKSDAFFLSLEKSDNLRKLVNEWRALNNVTLKEIASACGLSHNMIRQLLRPKSAIRLRKSFRETMHSLGLPATQ